MSVAIVALTDNRTVELEDGTTIEEPIFDWTSQQQGFALGSFIYCFYHFLIPLTYFP